MRIIRSSIFVFILLLFSTSLSGQQKYTVSGTVTDKKTGETIIGAAVWVREDLGRGTVTNEYGFYSLPLPAGNYTLIYAFLGYGEETRTVRLSGNVREDVALSEDATEIEAVLVTATARDENVVQTQVGLERIELREIAKMPVLFGEKDALKTIQLLPGIKGASEGSSGFFVRGGTADQNLILLDEAPVYNASHLLGFFSTFNSDAIKDVAVYKGNSPAQYGGRLSSVLDIKMNDGNNQRFVTSGGIGLIASRLNIEGPIQKGKSSFIVSGRRSYADLFMKLSNDETDRTSQLYFYDLNAKVNFSLGQKDRLLLSGYFGRDVMDRARIARLDWGNMTGTIRWNRILGERVFMNTLLIYSHYDTKAGMTFGDNSFGLKSSVRDWNFKQEYQFFTGERHKFRLGFNTIYHRIRPGEVVASEGSMMQPRKLEDRLGWENALFFSDEWRLGRKLNILYGLRYSAFSVLGPGTFYDFDGAGNVTGQQIYGRQKIVRTYFNPEPRISANLLLSPVSSIKGGYARNVQYLHMVSNTTGSNPMDVWLSTTLNVKPELSDIYSLGYFRNFADNRFEFSVEAYYKDLYRQVDYRDGADPQANEFLEGELLFGRGRAYGLEFFFKKRTGRFNGWISYTLSKAQRQIDGINDGRWYRASQDRTHDFSVVGILTLSDRWTVSAVWVYNTGSAVTFPSAKYRVDDQVYFYYTERNAQRMPAYHRLDLGATCYVRRSGKFESSWNFSLYNAYGRMNAYSIMFREGKDDPTITEAVQLSLFRWVPSVTYNFKF